MIFIFCIPQYVVRVTTQLNQVSTTMKENVESALLEHIVTQIQPGVVLCVQMEKLLTKKEAPALQNVDPVRKEFLPPAYTCTLRVSNDFI